MGAAGDKYQLAAAFWIGCTYQNHTQTRAVNEFDLVHRRMDLLVPCFCQITVNALFERWGCVQVSSFSEMIRA